MSTLPPVTNDCGNGRLDTGEGCDDGNRNSSDGCSSTCQVEPGFVCNPLCARTARGLELVNN